MSTNSNSSRDHQNAGSDSAGRYSQHPLDAYKASVLPTAPVTRSVGESAVKDLPQGKGSPDSTIKNY